MSDFKLFKPYRPSPNVVRQALTRVSNRAPAPRAVDAFVLAVIEFNETSDDPRSVAKLNAAYRQQRESNFGLDPTDYHPGGPRHGRSYRHDLRIARSRTIVRLYDEYARLEAKLNAAAEGLSHERSLTTLELVTPRG